MKQIVLGSLLVVFSVSFMYAQVPATSLKSGKLSFGKYVVSKTWEVKPILDALGGGYRLLDKTNKVYTYDGWGIAVFESKKNDEPTGILSEIQFFLGETEKNTVTPSSLFNGKLKIESITATGNVSFPYAKSHLKKYKQSESYTEHSYRFAYNGVYIYLLFNASETALKKVSIGQDKRKS